ncbi:hypothetical protein ACFY7C_07855 [Streptomyces sp. NPDC012769]|uniref:hypothetical protein n=1 Tax=Streptomyces sp. NPDC012769 TaxID=3364848 RepID=UPI0036B5377E
MRQQPRQQWVRPISLTVAATAVAATAVFLASGTGLAEGLGAAAAVEPVDGDTVGVSVGTTSGETAGETTSGGVDGGGETTGGGSVGVSEGTTTGESSVGTTSGGVDGGGETTGGGEPTPTPTPTPSTGRIPDTAHPCWSADSKPITGTFVAMVPAGTLPTGNKATLVELTFAPRTDPETGVRTDDEITTRFAQAGGAWTTALPVKLQLDATAIKPFRPVVDGSALKMPEIRLTDINCWSDTVAALGGTLRFGGDGGNGGVEVKVPVTWQRS